MFVEGTLNEFKDGKKKRDGIGVRQVEVKAAFFVFQQEKLKQVRIVRGVSG